MTTPLMTIEPDATITDAAKRMSRLDIRRLAVMYKGKLAGIVSGKDILHLLPQLLERRHPSIYGDAPATKARALLRDLNLRIIPVIDTNKKLLGKVSRRDVMTISSSVSPVTVKGIMTPARHVAAAEDDVNSAFKAMLRVDVWDAPVVASGERKTERGVVGLESFIETLMKNSPERFVKDVSDIMTKDVVFCSPDDEVDRIWRLM